MPEIINHSAQILNSLYLSEHDNPVHAVESAARTCYQSEYVPDAPFSQREDFVRRLIKRGHTAMLEFAEIGFRIITDRGVSHELVRHRIASWAQESTRYCNYGGKPLQFVKPVSLQADEHAVLP